MTTAAAKLVEFSQTAFSENILADVENVAILAMIDQYGLQIAGSTFPWSKGIFKYACEFYPRGKSSVTQHSLFLPPTEAAFVNGSFAHAQDFDDSHQEAQTHPGSVVIPAAIAVGEYLDLPGKMVLKAIIIGMEVMLRLAHSICPACIENGHHTPPTVGPFGAAIACGLLLGLTSQQMINALGICGSYSGGLVEYTLSGGSVKRIHTGIGARAGVEAALLAKEGITGPTSIIDGKKGLWEIFGRGKAVPERLFQDIGDQYMLTTLMFKPYNCCYLIHPAIEAFLSLRNANKITADDIESVSVGYSQFSISHAGKIIHPVDALGAQFSTSFTLALSLMKEPPGMWSYTEDNIKNKKILALAKRISVYEDAQAQADFPKKNSCVVTIHTKNKNNFSLRVTDPKGSPNNLMTEADVRKKYFKNTAPVISEQAAQILYDNIKNIRDLSSISMLTTQPRTISKL